MKLVKWENSKSTRRLFEQEIYALDSANMEILLKIGMQVYIRNVNSHKYFGRNFAIHKELLHVVAVLA
jgi:hypothetical protein